MKLIRLFGLILTLGVMMAGGGCSGTDSTTTGGPPADSSEAFSVGPFSVEAGQELIMCSYVRGTNAVAQDITRFDSVQSVGGHHLIVYTVDHPVSLAPARCSQGGQPGWSQILASGLPTETTSFPEGVGFHVQPHQQYVLEVHYINTSLAGIQGSSGFTATYAAAGTVKERASTYYIGTGNVDVNPSGSSSAEVTCTPPSALGLKTMFGHIHRYGVGVNVDFLPGGSGAAKHLYDTTEWENPPISTLGGGQLVGSTDSIRVKCDWNNPSASRLGYPAEMCFAVGYYWPATASLMCASGGGSTACDCWYPDSVSTGPGGATVQVDVTRIDTIAGVKGDPAGGAPIYCSLFKAEDWAGFTPKPGARPVYYRSRVDVPLPTTADRASFELADITPGSYFASCYMDTVFGGFVAGSGDPVNSAPVPVKVTAGETVKVFAVLDYALP